jgi:hypothetical protein
LKRANEFNIELEDVSITHMTFGKEFTRAVEQKQIAQQDAERARFTVEKVVIEMDMLISGGTRTSGECYSCRGRSRVCRYDCQSNRQGW